MGLYVEPKGDKLEWLTENGIMTTERGIVKDDEFLVCCVNNGFFFAAGVAFDDREMRAFTNREDPRQKFWFRVSKKLLKVNCPQWDSYITEEK